MASTRGRSRTCGCVAVLRLRCHCARQVHRCLCAVGLCRTLRPVRCDGGMRRRHSERRRSGRGPRAGARGVRRDRVALRAAALPLGRLRAEGGVVQGRQSHVRGGALRVERRIGGDERVQWQHGKVHDLFRVQLPTKNGEFGGAGAGKLEDAAGAREGA